MCLQCAVIMQNTKQFNKKLTGLFNIKCNSWHQKKKKKKIFKFWCDVQMRDGIRINENRVMDETSTHNIAVFYKCSG